MEIHPEVEYQHLFGPNSHKDVKNKEHFECFSKYARGISGVTRTALLQLQEALAMTNDDGMNDGRVRRVPVLPILAAAGGMMAIAGTAVYFGITLSQIQSKLVELERKLTAEMTFTSAIARNTELLEENGKVLALKTNIISTSFVVFSRWYTCTLFRMQSEMEKLRLFSRLELMVSDLLSGKFSTHVIPLSLLRDIMSETEWIKGTLLESNPILLYKEASVTLVSVNLEELSFKILLSFPNIPRKPDFIRINVLTPEVVVHTEGISKAVKVFAPNDLYLPRDFYEHSLNFPLLNESVFPFIRRMTGCVTLGNARICESVIPPEEKDLDCLKAIVKGHFSEGSCFIQTKVTRQEPLMVVAKGTTGALISLPVSFSVFGETEGKREQFVLGSGKTNERACVYCPGRFQKIVITNGTYEKQIKQSLTIAFQDSHSADGGFFNFSSPHWSDETELSKNISLQKFEKMARDFHTGPLGTGHSWELILIVILAVLFLAISGFIFAVYKGFIRIHVGEENRSNLGGQNLPWASIIGMANLLNPPNANA